jgi:hypothetical protein
VTLWTLVIVASLIVLAEKLLGYLVPPKLFESVPAKRVSGLLTVALLSALVAVNTLTTGQDLVLDARLPALLLACVLFALRVPFILVLIAAALCAALLRMAGLGL